MQDFEVGDDMKKLYDTSELEAAVFSPDQTADYEIEVEPVFPALELELTLEDGQILIYEAVGVFLAGEKEYIALHPKNDEENTIHIMKLNQGEDDEIQVSPITDEREFEDATAMFYSVLADFDIEGDV